MPRAKNRLHRPLDYSIVVINFHSELMKTLPPFYKICACASIPDKNKVP